jgi:putative nucleotidyltransferase with HDIG domain
VAEIADAIAHQLGLPEKQIEGINLAAVVHDVGKISIPSEILSKPGKLNNTEFSLIKRHAEMGYEILKEIEFPWPIAEAVRQHHERFDGSGYPQGLQGDEILLEARILAVADIIEAMASHRPYRAGLGINRALTEISNGYRNQLDPKIVDATLNLFHDGSFEVGVH